MKQGRVDRADMRLLNGAWLWQQAKENKATRNASIALRSSQTDEVINASVTPVHIKRAMQITSHVTALPVSKSAGVRPATCQLS